MFDRKDAVKMSKSSELMPNIDRKWTFVDNGAYDRMAFDTRAIEIGNDTDRSAVPIYASVTSGAGYQRHGDPSRDAVSRNIASLEGTRCALMTASGVSAMTLPLLALLGRGDRIICHYDLYIWTYFFVREDLPRLCGAQADMIDMTDLNQLEDALSRGNTKMIVLETIANPLMNVIDIKACAELAHRYGALVLVDNTFASPYLCRPAELGADIVAESLTKYINGHGDAMGGAICTSDEQLYLQFQRMMGVIGCCMSPFNSFLIMRGIQTLPLRMERHCDNAEAIVAWLAKQPYVYNLTYPGLAGHPQHALAKRQLKRFGGMLGFQLACDHDTLYNIVLKELRLFKHWVSLGEAHSLISPKDADPEKGIPADFIRVSAGLENSGDLIDDLKQAFSRVHWQ